MCLIRDVYFGAISKQVADTRNIYSAAAAQWALPTQTCAALAAAKHMNKWAVPTLPHP
jgi:hypothetical protein